MFVRVCCLRRKVLPIREPLPAFGSNFRLRVFVYKVEASSASGITTHFSIFRFGEAGIHIRLRGRTRWLLNSRS